MSVSYENISEICRLCLVSCDSTISIYTKLTDSVFLDIQDASTLREELEQITLIPIDPCDGLPSLICTNCVPLIHSAYKFKKQFDYSHNLLQKYLSDCEDSKDIICNEVTIDHGDDRVDGLIDYNVGFNVSNQSSKTSHKKQTEMDKTNICVKIEVDTETEFERSIQTILHQCPICDFKCTSSDLKDHVHTHPALNQYLHINKKKKLLHLTRFYKEYDPKNKIVSIHNRNEKLHQCVFCKLKMTASKLRLHIETHRNDKNKHYRVFKELHHLKTRQTTQCIEFPYICDKCGRAFAVEHKYENHLLTHKKLPRAAPEVINFPCNTCDKVFTYASGLSNHVRNIHQRKDAKTLCVMCGKYVPDISIHKREHFVINTLLE